MENLRYTCAFGTLRESLLKDIFICGLSDKYKNTKERLLSEGDIEWKKALEIAKSIEMAKENLATIQNGGSDEQIVAALRQFKNNYTPEHQQQSQHTPRQRQQLQQLTDCSKCGQKHRFKCPAEGVVCNSCGKKNHYARMCFMKTNNNRMKRNYRYVNSLCEDEISDEEEEECLFVGSVKDAKNKAKVWTIDVQMKNKYVNFQVDTGAQTNLMSLSTFKTLGIKMEDKVFHNIVTFSGEKLPVIGKTFVEII